MLQILSLINHDFLELKFLLEKEFKKTNFLIEFSPINSIKLSDNEIFYSFYIDIESPKNKFEIARVSLNKRLECDFEIITENDIHYEYIENFSKENIPKIINKLNKMLTVV